MPNNRKLCLSFFVYHFLLTVCHSQIQPIINGNELGNGGGNPVGAIPLQPGPPIPIPPLNQNVRNPRITDVSAMCAADGVTAQMMFDGPFFGMIYSKAYSTVHDCVYYNSYDMNMILFTIPNHKCGTKISRNSVNVVHRIENEVYVQFDKMTQTSEDRRFLFICELASASLDKIETQTPRQQTVRVDTEKFNTIEPTRIVVTQTSLEQDAITMEIQRGRGPFQPPVTDPVKLGDLMTLVVKQDRRDGVRGKFNMNVHSCYAADGAGQNRVELIDRNGCTTRPQVAGRMQRTKTADDDTLYYFRISAFKFPGPADVYFTCSVDVCSDCDYPPSCTGEQSFDGNGIFTKKRRRRSIGTQQNMKEIQVHDNVQIEDEDAQLQEAHTRAKLTREDERNERAIRLQRWCLDGPAMGTLMALLGSALLVAIVTIVYMMSVLRRQQIQNQKNPRNFHQSLQAISRATSCRSTKSTSTTASQTLSTNTDQSIFAIKNQYNSQSILDNSSRQRLPPPPAILT